MKITGEYKIIGDEYNGFYSNGLTMLGNASMQRIKQTVETENKTILKSEDGLELQIQHIKNKKTDAIEIQTQIQNNSDHDITLEMLTSFVIPDIKADKIHRLLSFWSAEGRLKTETIEELNLERSWNQLAIRVEKFSNLGSMPVRHYFPFVALEDSSNHTFTAIQLHSPSSWQIELVCQREESLTVAGGIADRDTGHWTKTLKPGQIFSVPKAIVAQGKTLEEACDKLVKSQNPDISKIDNKMGITFNEYCTTWGNPSIENLKKIVDKLDKEVPGQIQYLVMDSGWYLNEGEYWWEFTGNWEVNKKRFPNGLKELTDYIRSKNMIPGIWFEFEVVSSKSSLWNDVEHLVQKDGKPLTVGGRRFLDMENPWVINHLSQKVIKLLKDNNFGYIKIDYNDTMGLGCDGEESFGENLRRKICATQEFFKKIKKEIPDIVIENCSSGGHRLEPSFMELSSMASFSDAHEIPSLPIIAANVQRVIKPEQNQIWAVLRKDDSPTRLYYSMCATLLGRMGLSGDIYDLSDEQWKIVKNAISFYINASEIIKNGTTKIIANNVRSYNNPEGEQLVTRTFKDKELIVFHRFGKSKGINEVLKQFYPSINFEKINVLESFGCAEVDFSAQAWIIKK